MMAKGGRARMTSRGSRGGVWVLLPLLTGGGVGCALFADSAEDEARRAASAMLSEKAAMLIGTLRTSAPNPANEGTPAKTGPSPSGPTTPAPDPS